MELESLVHRDFRRKELEKKIVQPYSFPFDHRLAYWLNPTQSPVTGESINIVQRDQCCWGREQYEEVGIWIDRWKLQYKVVLPGLIWIETPSFQNRLRYC